MKNTILDKLENIERDYGVTIIHACESGSRAWGFASKDSDFDVRFIYAHPRDWYLTVGNKRDVIEKPVDAILDISGWDLLKSLGLLRKSNSPLQEWLASPIIYRKSEAAMAPFIELSRKAFLPETSCHHYLSLARGRLHTLRDAKEAKIKTYLYALRAVLCSEWIIKRMEQPPMPFRELLAEFVPAGDLRQYIEELLQKKQARERATVERSANLEEHVLSQIDALTNRIPKNPRKPPLEEFDATFISILKTIEK